MCGCASLSDLTILFIGPIKTDSLEDHSIAYRLLVSQTVSYFTVPPRANPSTGSQSGSAAPVLTQVEGRWTLVLRVLVSALGA